MVVPKDILLSAYQLIKLYGKDAEEHATRKLWEFKQQKNQKAAGTWQLVLEALKELRNTVPPGDLQ